MGEYTFGTGQEAAARLKLMADFFNPLAERLIASYRPSWTQTAVDLGCGPGFTTDMLSRAADAADTVGLDNSEAFLAQARTRFPRCRFIAHDVNATPFPVKADLMYVRFVLSHLAKPVAAVRDWLTQINRGGAIVIEETEAVETDVPVFRKYLSTSEELVASGGARLFVGAELASGDYGAPCLLNDRSVIGVPDRLAAAWFHPNTRTVWRASAIVRAKHDVGDIDRIADELEGLMRSESDASRITWKIRRIVLSKK